MSIAQTPSRRALAASVAAAALFAAGAALALPVPVGGPYPVNPGGGQPVISGNQGNLVTVDLNAQRTIIDWSNFNLQNGETARFAFDQRNWIVLNRVSSGPINVNGTIQAVHAPNPAAAGPTGGNVWFYSPAGVAFGSNARVDVGGLLATSAAPNTAAFLNAANVNIPFTGSGAGGPVTVAAGAQLNATAHVALVAPRVNTAAGSTTTVSDYGTALYGAADTFEIQFFPTFNNDLTLFTFIVPGRPAGTPIQQALTVAGQTTSGTIYLAAYSRAAVANEMINAPGLLTARSSFAEYGQVTITTGRNIILGQPGPGDNAPLANLNTGLTIGHARIGEINADGNVNVILTGTNYNQGPQGNLTATKIRAGQGLVIGGSVVTIPGGVSSGDAGVNARGANIVAGQQLTIPMITAAGDLFFGSRSAGSTFDRATSGGNLTVMNSQAVTGNLLSSVGSLTISSGGPVNVPNVSGGAVSLSLGSTANIASLTGSSSVNVGSNGALTFGSLSGGTVTVATASTVGIATLTGSVVDIGSVGALTVGSAVAGSSLVLRSNSPIDVSSVSAPTLTLSGLGVRVGTATVSGEALVRTPSMELLTSFTAGNLTIEGAAGRFQLGGSDEPGLTNAELQRIRVAGALNLYAGQRTPTAGNPNPQYGDFEVHDLTLDPTKIPRLNLFAHSGRQVSILGNVQVVSSSGALQIGDPTADSAWLPSRIVITGALGTAEGDAIAGFTDVRAFDHVELYATNDILLGSQRFVDLVLPVSPADIDIGRGLPLGVAAEGDEIGKLFVVAGNLRLTAGERIVQQNTGSPGLEGGLYLTGAGVEPDEPLLVVGGAQVADLFGAFDSGDGVLAIGAAGAFSNRIARPDGDTSQGQIRINGCLLGIGCALSTPASQFRVQQFRPAAPRAAIDPPVLTPPPPVDDDERQAEAVITGTGNEEIWRRDPQ